MSTDDQQVEFAKKDGGLAIRENILAIEQLMAAVPQAKIGDNDMCPLKHTFGDGIYMREIFIPKGTLLTGKIHRHAHPAFLMSGDLSLVTESGGVQRIQGPLAMMSTPGVKRLAYAHTDCVWITVHATKETDLKKIEEEQIVATYEQFEKERESLCHSSPSQLVEPQ